MVDNLQNFLNAALNLWGFQFTPLDILVSILLPLILFAAVYFVLLFLIRRLVLRPLNIKDITKKTIYR